MVTLIINPISGGARRPGAAQRVEIARRILASHDEKAVIVVSERRGHVRELAAAAVAAGSRLVIVWGGDGTVNEAGSVLIGGTIPLGMIPAGSGNGLARELGLPLDPERAIAITLNGTPRTIDAGELGGRPFFNMAGIGFDAHVASRFDRTSKRGLASYVRLSARELLTYRPGSYRIECGRESILHRALLVALANSPQFGNGARIAPSARLDDGRLDLVIYEEVSRFATICAMPRLFAGGIEAVRGLSVQQIERVRIDSEQPMTFHVDGEPVEGGTTLEARVLAGALRVCV